MPRYLVFWLFTALSVAEWQGAQDLPETVKIL